ncbi:MAG: response regulator transcription factor [Bacteroidia bacterium]|nr:response regulator transcription factor [Bacteroidia bacterium]HQV00962.1 LytTR family DNA-binding domain-containing protein [Bacteroidia bacterium]
MQHIKAIIVEDEPYNRQLLLAKLEQFYPQIRIVDACSNGQEALLLVKKYNPELVFLDIEMPVMNGFEFLKQYGPHDFEVIFVTSYDKYALQAIKFSALDFILKPIDNDELIAAVNQFLFKHKNGIDQKSLLQNLVGNMQTPKPENYRLALSTLDGTLFLNTDEIIRCEADSNYTKFVLHKRANLLASKTLKEFDELLTEHHFVRIHKSHLVNRKYIRKLSADGYVILHDESQVEVSRRRIAEVKIQLGL